MSRYDNAVIETKDGQRLDVLVEINKRSDWNDNAPGLGLKRQTRTEMQTWPTNPINIKSIACRVNGKDYTFAIEENQE